MTPARQPRQRRPLSRRSGRASSPAATHRNRFPTSSRRVSTAVAIAAEAAAASSTATAGPVKPRSYRPRMLRGAGRAGGSPAGKRARTRGAPHRSPEGHRDLGASRSSAPRAHRPAAPGCSHAHAHAHARTLTGAPQPGAVGGPAAAPAAAATPPWTGLLRLPIPRRLRAPRLLPPARAGAGSRGRGSEEPPQTESSARRRCPGGCRARQAKQSGAGGERNALPREHQEERLRVTSGRPLKGGGGGGAGAAGAACWFHPGSQNKLQVTPHISGAMFFRTQGASRLNLPKFRLKQQSCSPSSKTEQHFPLKTKQSNTFH